MSIDEVLKYRKGWLVLANDDSGIYSVCMSKTEILEELRKLTNIERQEIRLRLAELDRDDWLDGKEALTIHEKAVLEDRLAAYAKDPDTGSTWEEVEGRIRARLGRQPNG